MNQDCQHNRKYTLDDAKKVLAYQGDIRKIDNTLNTINRSNNTWHDCGEFKIDIKFKTTENDNQTSYTFFGSDYGNHDSHHAELTKKFKKMFVELLMGEKQLLEAMKNNLGE